MENTMKVLILSHNPLSTKHSIGKTLLSLFSEFKKEELCQLYIHGQPEVDGCSSYFRISDKAVLKGFFTRRVAGTEVTPVAAEPETASPSSGKSRKNNRLPHRELLRDLMWKLSPWYNRALRKWIDQQKPTCMFVALGSGKFLYDMALRIAKDYQLPIYPYVCDDFYTMAPSKTPLGFLWSKLLRRKTDRLMAKSQAIISICDPLSKTYEQIFCKPAVTVMTGTNFAVAESPRVTQTVDTIRYFGKVSLNRYQSLCAIGKALDRINRKKGTDVRLEVDCGGMEPEEERALEEWNCVRLCGFVSGQAFQEKFFSSPVLVHIEAFDEESIDRVRNSVSTKIADSLASGSPLFAYGPAQIASMDHLIRNNCAITATDEQQLEEQLCCLLEDAQLRRAAAEQGLAVARKHHDPKNQSNLVRLVLEQVGTLPLQ